MSVTEIVLIIGGGIVLLLGYLLPVNKIEEDREVLNQIEEEQMKEIVNRELEKLKAKIDDAAEETTTYSVEKAERSMERISNEKIMSVNEYSDTVLDSIKKNHEAVIFLYDMLNEKHDQYVKLAGDAVKSSKEIEERIRDAEILLQEMIEKKSKEAEENIETQIKNQTQHLVELQIRQQLEKQIKLLQESQKRAKMKNEKELQYAESKSLQVTEHSQNTKELSETNNEVGITQNHDVEIVQAASVHDGSLSGEAEPVSFPVSEVEKQGAGFKSSNNNDRILELHKRGKSHTAIARELSLGVGEVKLVIDLFEAD